MFVCIFSKTCEFSEIVLRFATGTSAHVPPLGLPLASYHNLPHAPCPDGCRHPQTKEPVKVRYGYHLVTDYRKASQGKKSHKDVEATIIHHFNTYTSITASKAKPFTNDKQADILFSGITIIDKPAARHLFSSTSRLPTPPG